MKRVRSAGENLAKPKRGSSVSLLLLILPLSCAAPASDRVEPAAAPTVFVTEADTPEPEPTPTPEPEPLFRFDPAEVRLMMNELYQKVFQAPAYEDELQWWVGHANQVVTRLQRRGMDADRARQVTVARMIDEFYRDPEVKLILERAANQELQDQFEDSLDNGFLGECEWSC